ncbi:MAG: tetratricopeptide repeat protein [Methanobacteriota archaeon]|nr:MAG: tetratricopeptide repeat protein [Euryarchaeota archaeon]
MARLVVSHDERLLLHLLELDKHKDMAQVPMGLCQEGIAKALGTKVHNVSRALSPLEAEGLVTDRLAHVQGAHRRRRAYSLTEKGREMAEAVRARVANSRVAWQDQGEAKELTVREILRQLSIASGKVPTMLEVVDIVRRGDALTPSLLERTEDQITEKPSTHEESHGRPRVDRFFGRAIELKSLTDALSGNDISIVQVYGMPGIGKSTLLSKVYDGIAGTRPVFWYTLREWESEHSFVDALADFLSNLGSRRLSRSLKAGTAVSEIHSQLVADLRSVSAVLFLDDVHKVADRMELLLTMLIDAVRSAPSVKLVLITRTAIHIVPKYVPQSLSIEIGELDHESAKELVISADVLDYESLLRDGHGHPMLLNLMATKGTGGGRRDVIDFFDSEIHAILPAKERMALEMLSVFRHPVMVEALPDVDYETISLLRRRSLVSEQDGGIWLHDLLREYLVTRLSAARKTDAHLAAGRYCEGQSETEAKLEALYHFIEAGQWKIASEVAIANGPQLTQQFPSETLGLVARIPKDLENAANLAQIGHLRGQLLESIGRYEDALSEYETSASLVSESEGIRATVLESVARLQAETDELSKSIEGHREALRLYDKAGDIEGMVREWLSIGVVRRRLGDSTAARECYQKALSIATKAENRAAQAACLNNMAILDWETGKPGEAERNFRDSMRLANSAKDDSGLARVLENYAQLCLSFNRLNEAGQLLLEASEAHFRADDVAEAKKLRARCAETMADDGRMGEAIELCETALSDDSLRRRRGLFRSASRFDDGDVLLILTLASLLRTSGNRIEAKAIVDKHIDAFEALDDSTSLAKMKLELALIAEESNDLEDAVGILREAEALIARAGDNEGLVAVHMRMGTVEEKRDDLEAAVLHYAQAARHAEVAGNEKARALALENIDAAKG